MNDFFNFTVTNICHIHFRMSNPNWGFTDLVNPNHYIIAYAESGKSHYLLDGVDTLIQRDQVLFFQRGEAHTAWADPEDPWLYFSFGFDLLPLNERAAAFLNQLPTQLEIRNPTRCRSLLFAIYRSWSTQQPGYYLEVRSLLLQLLQEIFGSARDDALTEIQRYRMQKTISYIHENLQENFSVAELAQIAGFSESYFSKLFRQLTGQSVITYQNFLRVTHARNLIQLGDCNVSEAAAAVGFRDIYYFSRMYKKLLGETPSGTIRKKQTQ